MKGLLRIITGAVLIALVLLSGCTGTKSPVTPAITPKPMETAVPVSTDTAPETIIPTTALVVTTTVPTPKPCIPNWSCSNWSACSTSDLQERTCTDRNDCGSEAGRPALSQQCMYKPMLPPPGPYTTSITGDMICRQTAEKAVNNLKYRASPDYEYFRKYVGAINCTYSDMCYWTGFGPGQTRFYTVCIASLENPPTVYIDQPFWAADPVWLAGVLVHEACHSEGYQEYILKEGADYDLYEFSDWKFERRCCDRMRTTWNQLGAPAYNNDLYRFCNL